MTEREKFLMRMAVIYLIANLDDAIEAFETTTSSPKDGEFQISVNGDKGPKAEEDELDQLMKTLQ